jgi:hypothetical protein
MLLLTRVSDTAGDRKIDPELLVTIILAGVSIGLFAMGITLLVLDTHLDVEE